MRVRSPSALTHAPLRGCGAAAGALLILMFGAVTALFDDVKHGGGHPCGRKAMDPTFKDAAVEMERRLRPCFGPSSDEVQQARTR